MEQKVEVAGRAWAFGEEHLCFADPDGWSWHRLRTQRAQSRATRPTLRARVAAPCGEFGPSAIALACGAAPIASADEMFYGLLRSRDLTPFGSLRLDMRSAYAVALEPGTWVVETELGYQNTWALSEEVEAYLTALEAQGRRDLGPQDLQAIQALPGENYLLDLESALLDVTLHYKFTKN